MTVAFDNKYNNHDLVVIVVIICVVLIFITVMPSVFIYNRLLITRYIFLLI